MASLSAPQSGSGSLGGAGLPGHAKNPAALGKLRFLGSAAVASQDGGYFGGVGLQPIPHMTQLPPSSSSLHVLT